MAVTIEKRPIGFVLGTCVSASINQDYSSAWATVNKTSHSLLDGDYVYIQSNVENYNGFWRVEVTNANEFILIDNPYVEWIVNADITYCPGIQTHGWQCVHLPIVYELSNTRWPTNSVDTARTISSISDDNGYVNLNLSGALGTFEDLAFIKISNSPDSDFDGVWQIIDKLSTSDVTINMAYSVVTASGITGATIQLYYSNYNMVVKVYAGLNSSHYWEDQKPYELAATLELIPDSDNRSKFSINDILKSYVETRNNLLLATLPNNLDAWTQFYIEVGEQYDTSDGYTVTTFEGAFASDQSVFEGYAANSMLSFKNIHSGHLSEYLIPVSWLTLFESLSVYSGQYWDLSFILSPNVNISYRVKNYINGVLQSTVDTNITPNSNEGLYRIAPEYNALSDEIRVSLLMDGINEQIENNTFTGTLLPWFNYGSSANTWAHNSNQARVTIPAGQSSDILLVAYPVWNPDGWQVSIGYVNSAPSTDIRMDIGGVLPGTGYSAFSPEQQLNAASGTLSFSSFTNEAYWPYFALRITNNSGSSATIDIDNVIITFGVSNVISDEITISIDEECSNQNLYLSWLNNLGGFDYWNFTAETDHTIDISNTGETKENIFPEWPKSYGEHADTIRKQTFRESSQRKFVFSQHLTQDQADAIAYVKSSPLVQIVNSRQDRRTVIVDSDSFTKYADGDKTFTIQFNILYTDNIPSQRV